VAVPVVLIVGLLLGGAGSNDKGATHPSQPTVLPPVTVSAPPSTSAATVSACAQVISGLPLTLAGQDVRRTESTPASGAIQAWGDPAIVLRCGVDRPKSLVPGSSAEYISTTGTSGPFYDVTTDDGANVYTSVDRAVYIAVTVPAKYHAAPMPTISRAIAKVLPPVCSTDPNEPDPAKLCTRRP
jgi:hypothetical protein